MAIATQIDRHTIERVCQDPGAVRPVFQPIVDVASGETRGHEVLAVIEPSDVPTPTWFAAAAEYGLAGALEARIVRAALSARVEVAEERFVAVNVTPVALRSSQFQALATQGLERVVFEVAEPYVEEDLESGLQPFRAAGVRVAVDSCGADATRLLEIAQVKPDFLKLHRRLVAGVDQDRARGVAIRALVELAGQSGASAVGVGIERREELDALRQLGVELAQGFLFGRRENTIGGAEGRAAALGA